MTFWYISFAMSREEGGFRGATVVEATSTENALTVATMRGLNPGGAAAILEVPRESEIDRDVHAYLNRLVGKDEIVARGGMRAGDMPQYMRDQFDAEATLVCSCCNPTRRH